MKKFFPYLYGREFSILTDHQPLTSIFHPHKEIPPMTAARLQRYALFLSGLLYTIEYRKTQQHFNCDGLSRLPLTTTETVDHNSAATDGADVFAVSQLITLPVTSAQIQRETLHDRVLSQAFQYTLHGWPSHSKDVRVELAPYFQRRNELSIHLGCLMWGGRVIVPHKLCSLILHQLNEGHLGVVKMKSLARSYVWWPSMDSAIEELTKQCAGCDSTQNIPVTALLYPWEVPVTPWQCIYMSTFADHS